jgi:ribose-phosphate pyrophosphokinase
MEFERIRYPDGQISAKYVEKSGNWELKERINSYEDLIFIKACSDAMRAKYDNIPFHMKLFIPCLFGQRSDRRFSEGQSFDLKIITDIINSCNFRKVEIFDPHSDISLALINNSVKITPDDQLKETLYNIERTYDHTNEHYLTLVSPDAGAYKKVFNFGQEINLPVVAAVKHRDKDGKVDLKFMGDVEDRDCLIIDDLCDGGYTFNVLGKALRDQGAKRVFLYVSHGYFSKGFDELKKNIDHIFCTNSVKDIEDPYVTQYKIV